MFNRYLRLYQVIIQFVMPFALSIPLSYLNKVSYSTKVMVLMFIVQFLTLNKTYVDLYNFWLIALLMQDKL